MPADRFGEPWPGATYHGFSRPAAGGPPPRPGPRRPSRGALIGGVAAAVVALGLALGFALKPDRRTLSADDRAEAQVTQHMPIQVERPALPPELPKPAGKLEVLNPATAQAARAARPAWPAPAAAAAPPAREASAVVPIPPPQDVPSRPPPSLALAGPAPTVAVPPARGADPCAGARSRAEALLCADPELAAYDREMSRAYRRAMRSGAVAPDDLRADQRDWLDLRERAADHSSDALADAYQRRIDELNRIGDAGPG